MSGVDDEQLKQEVARIVAASDMASTTQGTILAEMKGKFGEEVVASKKAIIKAAILVEVEKRTSNEQEPVKEEEAVKQAENEQDDGEDEEKPKKKKKAAPAPKKRQKNSESGGGGESESAKRRREEEEAREEAMKDLPTNVEADVDLDSFRRRNPGRSAKAPEKKRKDGPKKKERDPNKPKKPGKPMFLSEAMSEFMGVDVSTRTEVAAKLRAHIKEKNLQDPKDGRNILLANDEATKKLWPSNKKTTYFKLNQLISKHLFNKGERLDGGEVDEDEGDDASDEEEAGGGKQEEKIPPAASDAANGASPAAAAAVASSTTTSHAAAVAVDGEAKE